MGVCRFCGQAALDTRTDAEATDNCQCYEAQQRRKWREAAEQAKAIIGELFGEGAKARGLVPLGEDLVKVLCSAAALIGGGDVRNVNMEVPGVCKIKICAGKDCTIKVERSEGQRYCDETDARA